MPSRARKIRSLVHAWLVLDFFGEARRSGGASSTLTTTIFSQSFLALVFAALLYPEPPPVPFAAANLSLSTLMVGLSACDVEPLAARARADRTLLGTAPLGALQVAVARTLHGAFHLGLVTIGMALPPAILLACRQGAPLLVPAYLLLACLSAGLLAGALTVLLQAARLLLGGQRAALLAGTAKALLFGVGFAMFALSLPALDESAAALPVGRIGAELLPPYHAARLLGSPDPELWRLGALLAAAAALIALSSWLGDRERDQALAVRRPGLLARWTGWAAGPRPDRGVALFTLTMLWRSPGLRSRALPVLGVPTAMAFLALRGSDVEGRALLVNMALQFPAIYLPFVVAFLPQADQPGCRWVFDSAPELDQRRVQRAVWVALILGLLLPVVLVALAGLLLAGFPVARALPAAGFAYGIGGLAARLMVRSLAELPFSRDAEPDHPLELGNLLAFGIALAGAGAAVAWLNPAGTTLAAALALGALLWTLRPPAAGRGNASPRAGVEERSLS